MNDNTLVSMQLKEVATRIKELREILEISEQSMAEATDVSVEDYLQYETGEKDFSFTFIFKCAKTFKVDPTDLLSGMSPTLSSYSLTRKGDGLPITRREGFKYLNMAPLFKNKVAEPFYVVMPYKEEEQNAPVKLSTHEGQELDIIISGQMKAVIGEHTEILGPGDNIYYNSGTPHGMIAVGGADCVFYAIVLRSDAVKAAAAPEEVNRYDRMVTDLRKKKHPQKLICEKFINVKEDENGILTDISFNDPDKFNFAFDIVAEIAKKYPKKLAMVYVGNDDSEKKFTFSDIDRNVNMTANYFRSLGINKGDRVMLVLKRHYQFWFSILALHKIGAIAIPATNLLVEHDFEYRFKAAGVKGIVCTALGDVAHQADLGAADAGGVDVKILVGGSRDGWHDFNAEYEAFPDTFPRTADTACGEDLMLMFFTSGTTGYPKIAAHSFSYPLGHYVTAKYWHSVDRDGLHFTISDTGWGKALWGKLYGQWLCEAAVFVFDFEKFDANRILPMFAKYNITTFCAPPTMYRFFIKEDLSKFDLSSLKHCTIAGEALNPEVYEQWKKATGLKLMEGFGQTETTLSIYNPIGTTPKPGSMGRPNPLYDVYLDDGNGNELPAGEVGEICIRNKPCGLFKGYYRDEQKTAEAFRGGYYHTGDTAWRDEDGYFWYVGRTDDVIKSSGYRIGPFEIESVIMELPYVLECCVTAAPDPIRGQIVKATIVPCKRHRCFR
jgi:acetyl-CoA synthetase